VEYATAILNEMKFPKSKISLIAGMIMATKIPQSPKNHFEEIICDADLDYLGREDYDKNSDSLLQEIRINREITNKEWLEIQESFLLKHHYHTGSSKKLRNKNKNIILKKIQDKIKSYKNGTSRT
jgi:predicted metal-dependent HD superfamily phosphohydrolase